MPAELPRAIALRRLTEARREDCTLDPDLTFDILLDAIERPTSEMLKAGDAALARSLPVLLQHERRALAAIVWRAMWEVIE